MERFDIYLRGFAGSTEPPEVGLQRLFGLDRQRALDLLRSLPRVVKREVPEEYALRYQHALGMLGADFELRRCPIRPQQVIAIVGAGGGEEEPLREEFEAAFTLPPPRPPSSTAVAVPRMHATVLGAPPVVTPGAQPPAMTPAAYPAAMPPAAHAAATLPAAQAPPNVASAPQPIAASADGRAAPHVGGAQAPAGSPVHHPDTVVDPPRVFSPARTAPLAPPLEPIAARSAEATWSQSLPPPAMEVRSMHAEPRPVHAQPAVAAAAVAATALAPAPAVATAPAAASLWSGFSDTLAESRSAVRASVRPPGHATMPESRPPPAGIAATHPAPPAAHAPVHAPAAAPLPREASMVQLPRASLAPPASAAANLRPPSVAIPLNSAPQAGAWAPIPIEELNAAPPATGPQAWDAGIDPKGRPGWFMDNTGVYPNGAPATRDAASYPQGGATPQLRHSLAPAAPRGAAGAAATRDERGSAPGAHAHVHAAGANAHAPGQPLAGHAPAHGAHPGHAAGQHPGRRPPSPAGAAAPAVGTAPRAPGAAPAAIGLSAGRELPDEPSVALRWVVRVVIGLSLFVIVTTVRHIRALDSDVENVLATWGERRSLPEPAPPHKEDGNAHPELGPPAQQWMESDYHQFSNGDKDRVRGLVERFIAAGASELHVGAITTVGMTEIAGELIVQLPAEEAPRKAVLDVYEQYLQATFGGAAPPHPAPEGDLLHVTF